MKTLLVLLLLIAPSAWSQVGQTDFVCKVRMGIQSKDGNDYVTLHQGGAKLVARFRDHVCVSVAIFRHFTEAEKEAWLRKNSDSPWNKTSGTSPQQAWKTGDNQMLASYDPKERCLFIELASEAERRHAATKP